MILCSTWCSLLSTLRKDRAGEQSAAAQSSCDSGVPVQQADMDMPPGGVHGDRAGEGRDE